MANKKTSARMEPCIIGRAEEHNFRTSGVKDWREDLTHLNIYSEFRISSKERYDEIKKEYRIVVGQKMQKTAHPIREIVVLNITTKEQAERFCAEISRELKFQVLSWAIHLDEGHYDLKTKQWVPNYHAHFIVDTTVKTHDSVQRPKKKGSKVVRDSSGKIVYEFVDRYARSIIIKREDLSKLQDIAAKVTGLERGTPSSRKHIGSLRFKMQKLEEDLKILESEKEGLELATSKLNAERKESDTKIAAWADLLKGAAKSILELCGNALSNKRTEQSSQWYSKAISYKRNLENVINETPRENDLPEYICSLSEAITKFVLIFENLIVYSIKNMIRAAEKRKAEIQKSSVIDSAKRALLASFDKPATQQAKQLQEENIKLAKEISKLTEENANLEELNTKYRRENYSLRDERDKRIKFEDGYREKEGELAKHRDELDSISYGIITSGIKSEGFRLLECIGLQDLYGYERWQKIKHLTITRGDKQQERGIKLTR
ncbi:MAG: hypothetical protein IJV27_09925 [Prevotella sp.]|nr:hypothetical protein [Prevotella sp.]